MSETGRRYGCPSCGGGLQYDIASGRMKCDHCGGLTDISSLRDGTEEAGETGLMEVTEFHCPQCGAVVYSTDTSATGFCTFCGSDVILSARLGRTRRPASIVPFTVTREQCEQAYRDHLKHFHLTPASLKSEETISHFRPVYVPFWSYDVSASGPADLTGHRSFSDARYHYDETSTIHVDAEIRQQGILYDASSAFEDETAALLKHTDREAVPFHAAYLSGFYAQASDVPAETYESEAAATAVRLFMDQVKETYKMDSVEMTGNIDQAFGLPDAKFREKLIMMPVWLLAHREGKRVIYTAVNGRSGEVVCDVPVSTGKMAGVILALTAGLFLLLMNVLTVKPDVALVLCGFLALLIQWLFSGARTVLHNRRTRAFEPDFSGERKPFVGPAQALLKRKSESIAISAAARGKRWSSVINIGITVLIVLGAMFFSLGRSVLNALSDLGNAGDHLLPLGMALVLLILIGHTIWRTVQEKGMQGKGGALAPRLLTCVGGAAGLILMFSGQAEDILYYVCIAALLAAGIWELVVMNRAHNEYASRPVPFFGDSAEAAGKGEH